MTTPALEHRSIPRRIVGRYALFEAIASGGMAAVHLGRLMGPVGFSRTVAIKRLHENYASDPEFVAMFLDEARIVARIRHPNVVPMLDVVALERELLLVMEYVSGASLAELLRNAMASKKATPIPIAVAIIVNVLEGLHAAHEATNEKGEPLNIVHRDVSPQNVLVGTDGVARVLDFGVAKAIGRISHTRVGEVKGKIRYKPPENLAGSELTRAADIYSASIMLWEALVNRRLFDGENDGQIIHQMMTHPVELPSRLRHDLPRGLDGIVMRGLMRRPEDRYPTAKVMAELLEATVPPVTRSAVAAWVIDNAGDEIQRREARVMDVEADVPSVRPPAKEASHSEVIVRGVPNESVGRPLLAPNPHGNSSLGSMSRKVSALRRLRYWSKSHTYIALCALCIVALALMIRLHKTEGSADRVSAMAPAAASSLTATEGPERSAPAAPQATASSGPVVVDLDELSTKPASAAESADVAAPNSMSTRKRAVQVPLVKPASHKASSADSLYKRD